MYNLLIFNRIQKRNARVTDVIVKRLEEMGKTGWLETFMAGNSGEWVDVARTLHFIIILAVLISFTENFKGSNSSLT